MSDQARPWHTQLGANTLEPERRPAERKPSDAFVLSALARLKMPAKRLGTLYRLNTWAVMWQSRRLRHLDDAELVQLARRQRPALLRHGLKGRPLRIVAAAVREMTFRRLSMRHHPVQITGGLALLRGQIVEMATGEGKTITTLLPAIAAAMAGMPVHVVTVNEYLAERDSQTLRPVIEAFGLTVGVVTTETDHAERPDIYAADIVFATNKDVAFDYLRDRIALASTPSALAALSRRTLASNIRESRQTIARGLGFAIVDEVDSILIDEAQTPLIITAETDGEEQAAALATVLAVASSWQDGVHYKKQPQRRSIQLLPAADPEIEGFEPPIAEMIPLTARRERFSQALNALHFYIRDEHYIVTDDGIAIVDEYTGRVMADRQWQRGLHQMIEAKEQVELSALRDTTAQITYQTYFARYHSFGGMTGTAKEVARELALTHSRNVLRLPTHRRSRRRRMRTRFFGSSDARWAAIVGEARRVIARERAVLIGTRSVEASEIIAEKLRAAGLEPIILNARQDADEASIVAKAGEAGRITVATNMAGRGTDIPVPKEVEQRGGLHVVLSEFHTSARIDRQFYGRAGRQGQRGSAVAFVSLDDGLFVNRLPGTVRLLGFVTAGRKGRLPSLLAEGLRFAAQSRSERLGRRRRAQTVRHARQLEKSLGFRPDHI